jgi:hypothetical protein
MCDDSPKHILHRCSERQGHNLYVTNIGLAAPEAPGDFNASARRTQ